MQPCSRPKSSCASMGVIWKSAYTYLRHPLFGSRISGCEIGVLLDSRKSESSWDVDSLTQLGVSNFADDTTVQGAAPFGPGLKAGRFNSCCTSLSVPPPRISLHKGEGKRCPTCFRNDARRATSTHSGISANVHSEPPVGTLPPTKRRVRMPPVPEAIDTYCLPLWV
jgi:hypothetical protein